MKTHAHGVGVLLDVTQFEIFTQSADILSDSEFLEKLRTCSALSIEERLALINPACFERVEPERSAHQARETIQGRKSFARATTMITCQRDERYGSRCYQRAAEQDHFFPYKYGGPTLAANRIWLCSSCNSDKSASVQGLEIGQNIEGWLASYLQSLEKYFDGFFRGRR
jgi:5-methylcytosine-specific restriction endonuclease McrA